MESESPDLGHVSIFPGYPKWHTYDEENGEHREADELKRLATNGINGSDSKPVSGNGSGTDQDAVTSSDVVELVINSGTTTVANRRKDRGLVETEAVEGNLKPIVSRLLIPHIQEHSHQATAMT
jgi:hypothetical protein